MMWKSTIPVALMALLVLAASSIGRAGAAPDQAGSQTGTTVWTFDRLENIGGHKTTVLGQPKVIDSPIGKAVEFDGVDDALFIDNHPLAGAATFTWEAIFRPDGGEREQRWFHLAEHDPVTGADSEPDAVRNPGRRQAWYLDSHIQSGAASKTLMNRTSLHPLGAWYHVAAVYDGKEFSNYVDGVREGSGRSRTWLRTARAMRRSACGSTRCSTSRAPFTSRGSRAARSRLRSSSSHRQSDRQESAPPI